MSDPAPLFSIITPVYNTPLDVLEQMVLSVLAQTFDDWELILVDDCSHDDRVREYLRGVAAADPRVTLIERSQNGHIVAASNDGVRCGARRVHRAARPRRPAGRRGARAHGRARSSTSQRSTTSTATRTRSTPTGFLRRVPQAGLVTRDAARPHVHLPLLGAACLAVREVGGFHEGFEGSQDHDLVLRVTERARKIVHIPEVLYHWRVIPGSAAGDPHAKPYAWIAGVKAVQAHLDRLGIDATADFGPGQSTYRIIRKLDPGRAGQRGHPDRAARTGWSAASAASTSSRRSAHCSQHAGTTTSRSSSSTTPDPRRAVLDQLREVARGSSGWSPTTSRSTSARSATSACCTPTATSSSCSTTTSRSSSHGLPRPARRAAVRGGHRHDRRAAALPRRPGAARRSRARPSGWSTCWPRARTGTAGPFLVRETRRYRVGSALIVNREVSGILGGLPGHQAGRSTRSWAASRRQLPHQLRRRRPFAEGARAGYRLLWMAGPRPTTSRRATRQPAVFPREVRLLNRRWVLPNDDLYLPYLPESEPPDCHGRRVPTSRPGPLAVGSRLRSSGPAGPPPTGHRGRAGGAADVPAAGRHGEQRSGGGQDAEPVAPGIQYDTCSVT